MRYYHEPGDTVEVTRQDAFNEWAIRRLGITSPRKIEYRKYLSRAAMGRYTGNATTNGFAEPELWRIHTIWPFDNHEVDHVYSATIGRPSGFFQSRGSPSRSRPIPLPETSESDSTAYRCTRPAASI